MYYVLFFGATLTYCAFGEVTQAQVSTKSSLNSDSNGVKSKQNMGMPKNDTYWDKPDNMMRVPSNIERLQSKKKLLRQHPKSTIQKIIARNRKNKKTMYYRLTSKPTAPPASDDFIDDFVSERDDDVTTQKSANKKLRKGPKKSTKYRGQIQKMQPHLKKKMKRDVDRENTRIFQDFDEFELIDNNKTKDYDLVRTHFKNYW